MSVSVRNLYKNVTPNEGGLLNARGMFEILFENLTVKDFG